MPGPALPPTGILDGPIGLSTDGALYDGSEGSTVYVASISALSVGDDGGHTLDAIGSFPLDEGVKVEIDLTGGDLELCYSGQIGNGEYHHSEDGAVMQFVTPPLPTGGPYDVIFTTEGGYSFTYTIAVGGLTVIHRSFATNLFDLRASAGPPRDVGPRQISDEV